MPYGLIPYPHWSAAVCRIATLAYLLVWAWTEHAEAARLRGQDHEPRRAARGRGGISSAPQVERMIVPALLKVAKGLSAEVQVQILAATHSPLVLASLEPHFDEERDRFFCFDLAAGAVTFAETPWAKHGDAVAWLTSDVFGLEQARSAKRKPQSRRPRPGCGAMCRVCPQDCRRRSRFTPNCCGCLPGWTRSGRAGSSRWKEGKHDSVYPLPRTRDVR